MPVLEVARPRSAALAPFVASLHLAGAEMPPGFERALPGGQVHLMVNLHEDQFRTYPDGTAAPRTSGGAVLQGPHARATVIDTAEQRMVIGVDFRLGGAAAFFGGALAEARDRLVDLERLWGRDGAVVRERLLQAPTPEAKFAVVEGVLLDRLSRGRGAGPDPLIPFAAAAFERGASVAGVADAAGLLPGAFARRFEAGTGLTPKLYARVRRLQRVLGAAAATPGPAADWAAIAAEQHFADQSHLVHDFRDLTGLTPTAYRPRAVDEWNHVPVEAQDARA